MEQAHARSLAALQQFILLATTTKNASPRFLADLIKRATETPGTFVFTELLQVPAIQSLRASEEFQSYLTLLEIFSWGTYEEYKNIPTLPQLNEAQTQKLKQLSLLTLASPFIDSSDDGNTLTYSSLARSLSLPSSVALESLVTSCIYAGLLTARLSPTSDPPAVHIHTVAPLRDLRPQSLPAILQILSTWSKRCDGVISDLEDHIAKIKNDAQRRHLLAEKRQTVVDAAVLSTAQSDNGDKKAGKPGNTRSNKRDLDYEADGSDGDGMEVDEGFAEIIPGVGSSTRGTKRNRGRG